MRKLLSLLLVLVMSLLVVPQMAWAVTFSMTPTQIQSLYETYENPSGGTALFYSEATPMNAGAKFVGNLVGVNEPSWAQIQIGANYWGQPYGGAAGSAPTNLNLGLGSLSGFDKYGLYFDNTNESPWMYNLYFNAGYTTSGETNYYIQNTWTSIPNGSGSAIELDFANAQVYGGGYNGEWVDLSTISGLRLDHISNIGFNVGANVPMYTDTGMIDRTFEVQVSPVPEPATMAMLGMGILGLFGLKRKA